MIRESANHVKSMMNTALEDGVETARRMAKRSRHAAEDALEQTAHQIKKHPFRAIATGLGVGIGLGAMSMWLYRRNGNRNGRH
jgi:ElaB/YqjD/DUF883 family membrane-anchored ribosome-binding protein